MKLTRRAMLASAGVVVAGVAAGFHVTPALAAELPVANLQRGRWHHLAGTWDGHRWRTYVDGVEVRGISGGGDACLRLTAYMERCGSPCTGEVWVCNLALEERVDSLRIWRGVRAEIFLERRRSLPEEPIIRFDFSEGTGAMA